MIIKKKRIRKIDFLNYLNGENIRIGVTLDNYNVKKAYEIGFSIDLKNGETVLTSVIGPVTRKNAEGYYIIHKDKKMETKYRTIEWHWKQWCGRGKTEDMMDFIDVSYKRYPRDFIPPYSIELSIGTNSKGDSLILSPIIKCDTVNSSEILIHVINLFLEIFNECTILHDDLSDINISKTERLNWEILPQGDYPWEVRYLKIKPFIQKAKKGNQSVIEDRIKFIHSFNPDYIAIGRAGFSGYIVFEFTEKNIYLFESVYTDNATYVFDKNWKDISMLTKKDILTNELQKDRIIHRVETWKKRIDNLLR
ncbi:hypothetical protein [Thermoanaerobacterium sp. RBIITD]|uniref:hypothetical protein n=1 Tax=Thermoanaerobacterium sp. RBIITD TaxID=1550240 RepID=UPI000BB8174C|nr:hypothetical protein [Thermoanaerobacterium sp. RBIITD]SNX52905.1 hypothetical protein SAMN05660242_0370 [Thermoanaerobacterium sp. RBIITD]